MGPSLSQDQFTLITILIQLGIVAAVSTIYVRFDTFKRMLFNEDLGRKRKLYLMAHFGAIFGIGVFARLLLNYQAADLTLVSCLLVGMLAGPAAGAGVGIIVGIPPVLFGEYLSLPFAIVCGVSGGLIYLKERSLEKRMDFSPLSILKIQNFIKEIFSRRSVPPQMLIIIFGMILTLGNIFISSRFESSYLFGLHSENSFVIICIVLSTFANIGIPLKIWNNTRVELLLGEKELKLTEARLEAIKSKIKPHFLFNTLNTIYSSIRNDPSRARAIVLRLSEVLRSVLDVKGEFSKLSDEINIIESYLSIEEARFGQGRVRFDKEISQDVADQYVPVMLLQPIVENCVKHGISKNVDSGIIKLKAEKANGRLSISLTDNGAGIPSYRLPVIKREGIGLSTIDERLKVLFDNDFIFEIKSEQQKGTTVRIEIPIVSKFRGKSEKI